MGVQCKIIITIVRRYWWASNMSSAWCVVENALTISCCLELCAIWLPILMYCLICDSRCTLPFLTICWFIKSSTWSGFCTGLNGKSSSRRLVHLPGYPAALSYLAPRCRMVVLIVLRTCVAFVPSGTNSYIRVSLSELPVVHGSLGYWCEPHVWWHQQFESCQFITDHTYIYFSLCFPSSTFFNVLHP